MHKTLENMCLGVILCVSDGTLDLQLPLRLSGLEEVKTGETAAKVVKSCLKLPFDEVERK
jgi:hypothetical protein